MPLNKLHEMIQEAFKEMAEEGMYPSQIYISDRYKEPLLKDRAEYLKDAYCLTYYATPVVFADLADNIHFYITSEVD